MNPQSKAKRNKGAEGFNAVSLFIRIFNTENQLITDFSD